MKLVKHVTTASRARDKQRRFRFFLPRTWRGTSRHQVSVTREIPLRAFSHLSVSSNPAPRYIYIYIYTYTDTHTNTFDLTPDPKVGHPKLGCRRIEERMERKDTRFFHFHIRERASAN